MYPGKESQNSHKRYIWQHIAFYWASLVAQMVKNLPALQETQIQPLGQKDPPEKGMAPVLVLLPGEYHGQSSLAGYSPWGQKELDTTATKHTHY